VRDLVTASGTVLASYDYDPYGNPTRSTIQTSGTRADYRYAGLFYHSPSGLYLTHYRVYDPRTARWLSRDPIGEAGGINLYGYVGRDPVSRIDPMGLLYIAIRVELSDHFVVFHAEDGPKIPVPTVEGIFRIPDAPCYFWCFIPDEEWERAMNKANAKDGASCDSKA
jgi:RHS repeat-associated protein